MPIGSIVALVLALLVPVFFYIAATPKSEAFKPLTTVEGIPVYIPYANAKIGQWQPMVERCVSKYKEAYQDTRKLTEVIVTGGQNYQISLNYIHDSSDNDDNVTYVLLTSYQESDSLCR